MAMVPALNESHVEDAALDWFRELGYAIVRRSHNSRVMCALMKDLP